MLGWDSVVSEMHGCLSVKEFSFICDCDRVVKRIGGLENHVCKV